METDEVGKNLYTAVEDADRKIVQKVTEISARRGVPRAQVALAWMLQKPPVTSPIIGASKAHHLDDAIAALSLNLSNEEMAALEEPYVPHPIAGFV